MSSSTQQQAPAEDEPQWEQELGTGRWYIPWREECKFQLLDILDVSPKRLPSRELCEMVLRGMVRLSGFNGNDPVSLSKSP